MNSTLAIYEALLQANVPAPAARGVAEALKKDMTTQLATKQDFEVLSTKLEALESRLDLKLHNLESRLLIRLGVLITVLFGLAAGLVTLLR
jgi:hypothetical protein